MRDWLKDNKIFFETVAAFALSVMATIVSVAQLVLVRQQNELISLQTQVAEAQALPSFEIGTRQIRNPDSGKFDDDRLEIKNDGGAIHDFSASVAEFLFINAYRPRTDALVRKIEIPFSGFYNSQGVSAAGKGILTTFFGYRNNATLIELTRKATSVAQDRGWDTTLLNQKIFLRLVYRDILNRQHYDYFEVANVGAAVQIETSVGAARFKAWDEAPRKVDLSQLTPEFLIDSLERTSPPTK